MITKLAENKKIGFNKRYLDVDELSRMVEEQHGERVRSERSYELEAMDVKMKDLKNFTKEDVDELRIIHQNDWRYKLYFSWFWDHIPKLISLIASLILFTYWFGTESLIAFLPITLVIGVVMFFLQFTRGY
jgi:hypothetical protein